MKFEAEHVKILRETLAYSINYGPKDIARRAYEALSRFSKLVAPYCEHPDRSKLNNDFICLTCGKKGLPK